MVERGYLTRIQVHLYKRKGNPQVCDNHRGISLIDCWKDTSKIILNCLNVHLDQTGSIPESHCGFKEDRGTKYMILQQHKFKGNVKNKMWTSTWPLSTSTKHSTQSVVMGLGKLRQSLAVQPDSYPWSCNFIMRCRHVFRMMESTLNHFR